MKTKRIFIVLLACLILVGCQNNSDYFNKYSGNYTESSYSNKGLGFEFVVPEGAVLQSEQEILDSDAARLEGKTEEEIAILNKSKKLLHATYSISGTSVYAYLEYYEDGKDVDSYLEDMKLFYSSSDTMVPSFGDQYVASLFAEQFQVLPFELMYLDVFTMVYAKQIDANYILAITFSYPSGSDVEVVELIKAFEKLQD